VEQRIWGTLSSFFPPKKEGLLGINIANDRFIQALIRYSTFDELHFFLTNRHFEHRFREAYADAISQYSGVLRFFTRSDLPTQLSANEYTVFHFSDQHVHMHDFSFLRNRYGSFPITAFIHSLSYCSSLSSYGRYHLGGFSSSDAILCSSTPGKEVLEKQLSETARKQGVKCTPIQRIVVPLGMEDIAIDVSKEKVRSKLKLPKDARIAICMGRFSDYDKMDLVPLLQAMRVMPDNALLILAGNVQNEDYFAILRLWIRALRIQHRVRIFQSPSEAIKKGLFRASDFFVSIADNPQETFGLSLLEGMSAGLPLVVSDYNGYKELCTPDVGVRIPTSWVRTPLISELSPVLDPSMLHRQLAQSLALDNRVLRETMLSFFTDSERCERLGHAARQRFLSMYHSKIVIGELEKIWDQLKRDYVPPQHKENIMEMDYFDVFSHYPTEWLTADTQLRKTDFSDWWSTTGADYPILSGMQDWLHKEWITWVLERLPSRVTDLEKKWDGDVERLHYTIQWMRKQDLLETLS
jgi:glycosyltransferase involved in cell wall biosynthesis